MSLETLLNTLVPQVPPAKNTGEPLKAASNKGGSLGSPGSPIKTSRLDKALAAATHGLPISPEEVHAALAPEDIADWHKGKINAETLVAFTRSLVQRREMEQGKVPAQFTERATCKHCGPVWLWFSGEVLGCPWCWNRATGKPIPHPHSKNGESR